MTPQQLLDAAEVIEQTNAMENLPLDAPINPSYLRAEAARIEQPPRTVAEQLDCAQSGEEFGQVLQGLFSTLEQARDETDEETP